MKVSLAALVLLLLNNINNQVTAFRSSYVHKHLSSRTPYRFISNKNDTQITYPDCQDKKIWMIIRHGTRFPCKNDMEKIKNLKKLKETILSQHRLGKGQLTGDQLKEIEDWNRELDIASSSLLALEGQDEMVLLAERMRNRFPNAIKEKYDNETFLFRHTPTERTYKSARSFARGLFEHQDAQTVVYASVKKVDNVLRFYKHCDRWQNKIKKNPETYKEQQMYGISREMNETLESVSNRLGLDTVIALDEAIIIYKYCGYETAWQKNYTSPWCSAFDEKAIQTMDYFCDLKTYWLDGYGFELSHKLACVAFKHMFDTFRKERSASATFLFTHSGTILKLLTYLGLYKEESPLRGVNLAEDRIWRTTEIDCFGANIAFVLFECESGLRILTLHQEKIVRLPMCSEDLCPLETLKEYFGDSMKNCDWEKMCKYTGNDKENKRSREIDDDL